MHPSPALGAAMVAVVALAMLALVATLGAVVTGLEVARALEGRAARHRQGGGRAARALAGGFGAGRRRFADREAAADARVVDRARAAGFILGHQRVAGLEEDVVAVR